MDAHTSYVHIDKKRHELKFELDLEHGTALVHLVGNKTGPYGHMEQVDVVWKGTLKDFFDLTLDLVKLGKKGELYTTHKPLLAKVMQWRQHWENNPAMEGYAWRHIHTVPFQFIFNNGTIAWIDSVRVKMLRGSA